MKCPKCGGEMEEGFLKGIRPDDGNIQWGKLGVKPNFNNQLKDGIDIKSCKCKNCGYLENYAK